VSASADGSTKVWDLRQKERDELPDKLNYTENDAYFFTTQLMHSSYVYGAKIFPETNSERPLLVATACFDQLVRLWSVPIDGTAPPTMRNVTYSLSILEKPLRTLGAK
jgi:WD40 repeat protein